jgi:catechol 2,3-dioxygenase-like lactoylglutathione lyase family enzyme
MITGLAHVCFTVTDLERAIAFYRDGLGLKPAFDFTDDNGQRYGIYFHVGGRNFIELFQGELDPPIEGQSFRHFCIEVDDIEATVETLRERGIQVSEIKMGRDHSYQAWIQDPDGNRIELHDYTSESWQAPHLA